MTYSAHCEGPINGTFLGVLPQDMLCAPVTAKRDIYVNIHFLCFSAASISESNTVIPHKTVECTFYVIYSFYDM